MTTTPPPSNAPAPASDPHDHQSLLERLNRRRQRLWRRTKRVVRWGIGVPVVLGLVALVVSRSPVVRWVVGSRIEAQTGCEFSARKVYIELDGRLMMRDPVFRVPGVQGEAGKLLSAETASVELDWSGALTGHVTPIAVRLQRPRFLLSQSTSDSELNVASLASVGASGGGGAGAGGGADGFLPPEVSISDGVLVFAEHDSAGNVTTLNEIRADGWLLPVRGGKPVYAVSMTESREGAGAGGARGMVLDGRVDLQEGRSDLRLRNISLASWDAQKVPSAYRDVWRRMGVKGEITRVDMSATRQGGVAVEIAVSSVGMSALVPAGNPDDRGGAPAPDLRLSGVNGRIRIAKSGVRAELEGQIDGQQGISRVRLQTQGLDATSPMTCEIRGSRIKVTKDPAFLFYVPKTVREYFEYFSGPTADVDVVATIARASPVNGQVSPVTVTGTLAFRNGSAAFHKFPYPFSDMSGVVRFDESRLMIDQIRGRGPTGALMTATGVIGPLTDDAKVDVKINVQRVPVDRHLLDAMPKDRREVTNLVFDREEYDRLLAANLIRRPSELGIDGTRLAPPCPFAGESDIQVHIERELGPAGNWTTIVDARFKELGVVAKPFPLPVIGRDVHLRITDTEASIEDGQFVAPRGGFAIVNARVVFFENDRRVVKPTMHVSAKDLPVDELLMRAARKERGTEAPESAKATGDSSESGQPRESLSDALLDRVALSGTVDCEVALDGTRGHSGTGAVAAGEAPSAKDVWYDLKINMSGLRAQPLISGEPAGLALSEFLGDMELSPHRVKVENVRARLVRTKGPSGPQPLSMDVGPMLPAGAADAGHVALWLDAALGDAPDAGRLSTTAQLTGLRLEDPIEDVAQVVSPEAGAWLTRMRSERSPTGLVDVVVRAGRQSEHRDQSPDVSVSVARAHDVSFSGLGGRVGVDLVDGSLLLSVPLEGPATLRAASVNADMSFDNVDAGGARIDGLVTIDPKSAQVISPTSATASARLWRFESPVVSAILNTMGGETAARRYAQFSPSGTFDADVQLLTSDAPATASAGQSPSPDVRGSIRPHTLTLIANQRLVSLNSIEGELTFASGQGQGEFSGCASGLVAHADEWVARVDGSFAGSGTGAERSVRLDLGIGVDARRADDALLALVPQSARDAMQSLDVRLNGPIELRAARLHGAMDSPAQPLMFAGTLVFADATLNAGLAVERLSGELDIDVASHSAPADRPPGENGAPAAAAPDDVRLALRSPSLLLSGLSIDDLELQASSTPRAGEMLIEQFTAGAHGGRIAGSAFVQPSGEAGRRTYRVDAVAAGVAFAPLLEELSRVGAVEPLVGPMPDASRDPDVSRGRLDASISIAGVTGDQRSRMGRGAVRVANGDVLRLPVILPLMQLSNLVLPSEENLRGLEAEFFLTGSRLNVSSAVASGKTIALEGSGTVDFPSMALDFRFNSRNTSPIPILSGIWEALRNEIVSTHITGSMSEPKIGSESFAGLRGLFRGSRRDQELDWTDAERRSAELSDIGLLRQGERVWATIPPITEAAGAPPQGGRDER